MAKGDNDILNNQQQEQNLVDESVENEVYDSEEEKNAAADMKRQKRESQREGNEESDSDFDISQGESVVTGQLKGEDKVIQQENNPEGNFNKLGADESKEENNLEESIDLFEQEEYGDEEQEENKLSLDPGKFDKWRELAEKEEENNIGDEDWLDALDDSVNSQEGVFFTDDVRNQIDSLNAEQSKEQGNLDQFGGNPADDDEQKVIDNADSKVFVNEVKGLPSISKESNGQLGQSGGAAQEIQLPDGFEGSNPDDGKNEQPTDNNKEAAREAAGKSSKETGKSVVEQNQIIRENNNQVDEEPQKNSVNEEDAQPGDQKEEKTEEEEEFVIEYNDELSAEEKRELTGIKLALSASRMEKKSLNDLATEQITVKDVIGTGFDDENRGLLTGFNDSMEKIQVFAREMKAANGTTSKEAEVYRKFGEGFKKSVVWIEENENVLKEKLRDYLIHNDVDRVNQDVLSDFSAVVDDYGNISAAAGLGIREYREEEKKEEPLVQDNQPVNVEQQNVQPANDAPQVRHELTKREKAELSFYKDRLKDIVKNTYGDKESAVAQRGTLADAFETDFAQRGNNYDSFAEVSGIIVRFQDYMQKLADREGNEKEEEEFYFLYGDDIRKDVRWFKNNYEAFNKKIENAWGKEKTNPIKNPKKLSDAHTLIEKYGKEMKSISDGLDDIAIDADINEFEQLERPEPVQQEQKPNPKINGIEMDVDGPLFSDDEEEVIHVEESQVQGGNPQVQENNNGNQQVSGNNNQNQYIREEDLISNQVAGENPQVQENNNGNNQPNENLNTEAREAAGKVSDKAEQTIVEQNQEQPHPVNADNPVDPVDFKVEEEKKDEITPEDGGLFGPSISGLGELFDSEGKPQKSKRDFILQHTEKAFRKMQPGIFGRLFTSKLYDNMLDAVTALREKGKTADQDEFNELFRNAAQAVEKYYKKRNKTFGRMTDSGQQRSDAAKYLKDFFKMVTKPDSAAFKQAYGEYENQKDEELAELDFDDLSKLSDAATDVKAREEVKAVKEEKQEIKEEEKKIEDEVQKDIKEDAKEDVKKAEEAPVEKQAYTEGIEFDKVHGKYVKFDVTGKAAGAEWIERMKIKNGGTLSPQDLDKLQQYLSTPDGMTKMAEQNRTAQAYHTNERENAVDQKLYTLDEVVKQPRQFSAQPVQMENKTEKKAERGFTVEKIPTVSYVNGKEVEGGDTVLDDVLQKAKNAMGAGYDEKVEKNITDFYYKAKGAKESMVKASDSTGAYNGLDDAAAVVGFEAFKEKLSSGSITAADRNMLKSSKFIDKKLDLSKQMVTGLIGNRAWNNVNCEKYILDSAKLKTTVGNFSKKWDGISDMYQKIAEDPELKQKYTRSKSVHVPSHRTLEVPSKGSKNIAVH